MKAEVEGYLKVERYKHQDPLERVDYRNGYYHRNLVTSFGLLEGLEVGTSPCG